MKVVNRKLVLVYINYYDSYTMLCLGGINTYINWKWILRLSCISFHILFSYLYAYRLVSCYCCNSIYQSGATLDMIQLKGEFNLQSCKIALCRSICIYCISANKCFLPLLVWKVIFSVEVVHETNTKFCKWAILKNVCHGYDLFQFWALQ